MRVLNIKETRKTRGGALYPGPYNRMYFFCLQVDGPITGGAYKRQFTVYCVIAGVFVDIEMNI